MRWLVPAAVVLAALLVGAVVLRKPQETSRTATATGACRDAARCGDAVPATERTAVTTATPAATERPPTQTPPPRTPVPPSPTAAADGVALRAEADRLIAAGRVVEGIEVFRKAVAADPTAKNHGDLGGLLYRLTAFDEAALHLRAAAELDPGNADRWIALANVYYQKVNPGEAWKAEQRARDAEPGLQLGRDAEGMRVRK